MLCTTSWKKRELLEQMLERKKRQKKNKLTKKLNKKCKKENKTRQMTVKKKRKTKNCVRLRNLKCTERRVELMVDSVQQRKTNTRQKTKRGCF